MSGQTFVRSKTNKQNNTRYIGSHDVYEKINVLRTRVVRQFQKKNRHRLISTDIQLTVEHLLSYMYRERLHRGI